VEGGVRNVVNPDAFPGWEEISVAEELSARLEFPVFVENDATAAAIGESFYGAGAGLSNFLYVFLGAGLGGGFVLNGQPFRGAQGNAGELGFWPLADGAERLGQYFRLPTLYERLATEGVLARSPADLGKLLAAGHPTLLAWLDEGARKLAPALVASEYLMDPEAIIFGGSWPAPLLDALIARLDALVPPLRIRLKPYEPRLIRTETGEDAAALGVATLSFFSVLSPLFGVQGHRTPPHPLALSGRRG
jgi:predicted NBD/HSP70 family sugar kinase